MYTIIKPLHFTSPKTDNAQVDIQVGKVTGHVTFHSEKLAECSYKPSTNIKTLIDAGIELDFSSLCKDFVYMLANRAECEMESYVTKAKEIYRKDWCNTVEWDRVEGFTVERETLEDFLIKVVNWVNKGAQYSMPQVKDLVIKYKEEQCTVKYGELSNNERWSTRSTGKWRYSMDNKFTAYKTRNYKEFDTLVKKFVELVDLAQEELQLRKQAAAKRDTANDELLETLKGLFGENIEVKNERITPKQRRGAPYQESYNKVTHRIVCGARKVTISRKYNNENLFNFGSFDNLTQQQVLEMMKVLQA